MNTQLTIEEVSEKIKNYIQEIYLFGYEESELCDNSSFLELGILDSTGIMELIVFLETEFEIKVQDEEILPENLDSINCASNYVYKKLN